MLASLTEASFKDIVSLIMNGEAQPLFNYPLEVPRDLMERKKAEDRLRGFNEALERKVAERTEELSKLARKLERAVKARDDFMSLASHELKTPLTTLKLQTQMRKRSIQKKGLASLTPEDLNQMLDDDEKQINRLSSLVDDMLDITRITSGKLVLQPKKFDLALLVGEVIARFNPQLQAAGCEITLLAGEPVEGYWDPYRIEQVFTNLLTNAMKYGRGCPISVSVERADGMARLGVRDQGIGIAPEDQERVFQLFERVAMANELSLSGLGLGLYIVRQIVVTHGGTIKIESGPGQGSLFLVELPLGSIGDAG